MLDARRRLGGPLLPAADRPFALGGSGRPCWEAEHTTAAGEGDSGGPVYVYGEDGGVMALGTISTADADTPTQCAGVFGYRNQVRRCFWRFWFSNIEFARAHHGAEVNVWVDQVTTRSGRRLVGTPA